MPDFKDPLARQSVLWGDQYALTMAQAFFTTGKHNVNATFHAFIRKNPFGGAYLVTAGQNIVFEWLQRWRFGADEIEWMKRKTVTDPGTGESHRLFTDDFIAMVKDAKLELSIDAMPEGELAFPDEPIMRVHGPLWQCLMVEAALLNVINSQSLFATLAARLTDVAGGAPILEFGLRRAQCIGGLEPSRAAWIGGVAGTSNMQADLAYGIPSTGTFAHAWVMVYEDEVESFADYARAMPHNGVFLVDTYDTVQGVKRAIAACQSAGITMKGIRLDSGDLAYLSKRSRALLDAAGFTDAKIVASNDLDEETILAIRQEGGRIDMWGVGTNLATSKAQPALGAVYKLGAVFGADLSQADIDAMRTQVQAGKMPHLDAHFMRDVIKLSEQSIKTSIPGELDVIRYVVYDGDKPVRYNGDTILPVFMADPARDGVLIHPLTSIRRDDDTRRKRFAPGVHVYRPLASVFRAGAMIIPLEDVHMARARAINGLKMLDPTHRRLKNPHVYVVGIEEGLYKNRRDMILRLRDSATAA